MATGLQLFERMRMVGPSVSFRIVRDNEVLCEREDGQVMTLLYSQTEGLIFLHAFDFISNISCT